MKVKRLSGVFIFICLSTGLHAEAHPASLELLGGLNADALESLERNDHIFRYDEENSGIQYFPETQGFGSLETMHQNLKPEVMVEALYRLPYPEGFDPDSEEILDIVYDLSHRVSLISGVKYFSVRKQDHEVLFTDVYRVNNLDEHKRMGDPLPGSQSPGESIYLHMKENALGSGYYRMDYQREQNSLSIMITNETDLGFIIPAVSVEDMIIYLNLIPCSDSILIYGYCGVVLQNDPIVRLLLDPYYAFYRRMTAMETWLYNSLHDTDRLPPLMDPLP
ncbi:MAG: hypothetical protein JEZ04_20215 [Spirochaetales bacterium]|nr:hypothetical protein [Spirochaetales bacterium]